jgi:hypothetical protein
LGRPPAASKLPAHAPRKVYPTRHVIVPRTILLVALGFAFTAGVAGAQQAGADQGEQGAAPRLTVRAEPLHGFSVRLPASFQPGGRYGRRSTPELAGVEWLTKVERGIAAARDSAFEGRLLRSLGLVAAETAAPRRRRVAENIPRPEDLLEPRAPTAEQPSAFKSVAQYADLGIDVNARLELKFDQLRNERCTASDVNDPALGCRGGFPTPSFNEEFRVRAGGIISQRVVVDVDFDSEREFTANNNISVFYQGLEDEILRRVEVGNVTFRAPASRFITAAVPSNSFGVQAEAQTGPFEFRGIVAQQKGSAIRTRDFTIGETTTQPVALESRDLDFEQGRFFFLVNPRALPGYPQVDVLNINRDILPAPLQVAQARIYRLRAQSGQSVSNPNLGGIDAVAVRDDSPQRVGPFSWELLVEGQDYYIDPSGTWFALGSRLGVDDFLAVSYVTVAGDTVGTFPAVNGTLDTLELISEPRRGPDVPTYFYEMRNAYRIAGSDVDRSSLSLALRVGTSETPLDAEGTYLSRLGLALSSDESTFDEFNRVFPRLRDPGGGLPVRELFVVFPHLQPFADSARLQEGERNDSLYRTPGYLIRSQGPPSRFALEFGYEATGAGSRSTLSLGSIQIRAGSDRLYLGDRLLVRGQDYEIDYGLGQVTFLNPDALFSGVTRVRAQFEENQLFDQAPKTLLGFSTTYDVRGVGYVSALGIFQQERTLSTRPTLGFEPEAGFIGGISTDLRFRADALTRAFDALPLISTTVPSQLSINGEVALSAPNPNRTGAAYVEDFEGLAAFGITLTDRLFQFGGAPSSGRGLPPTHLGTTGAFDPEDATQVVWQNLVQSGTGALQFRPQDIDSTITVAGQGVDYETLLWLTMKPDTVGGLPDPFTGLPRWNRPHTPGPRWRSITQPLGGGSGLGVDLSRVEFLEFWVLEDAQRQAREQDAYLVFDFGRVFEDAVAFAPQSFTTSGADTTFDGMQFVGVGRLDSEKDSVSNVFNAQVDDNGILGDRPDTLLNATTGEILTDVPLCNLQGLSGLAAFPLGDFAARCSRGNGYIDTEDLNGDNRLDIRVGTVEEDVVRYVFPIGDEQYHVRDGQNLTDGAGRTLTWRLYRIPFRVDTLQIGRPNLRQIQALRLTMVSPDEGGADLEKEIWVALARMRLVGAPWVKRAETPITGIAGGRGVGRGEVAASIVTTENTDLGYTPPPGVSNLPPSVDVGLSVGTVQINEKSLRLLAIDLQQGERAEAYTRFTGEADRNFLNYRQLRVWARGRGTGWNEGDLEFYVKVGRDENNFYLYRARARTDTWEPEVQVDIERWLALRADVEARWLAGEPPSDAAACGGDSTAYVACDGPYMVHVRDPATSPPNLAAVSEVAVGMFRVNDTGPIDVAELWVDDIRLVGVVDAPGVAAALDVRVSAADVAELSVSLLRRDDRFRQLGEDPTYVTNSATRIGGLFRIDKLLPESWGLAIPFSVQYGRTSAAPYYVNRTDVRADALANLRNPGGTSTALQLSLRRVRRGTTFLAHSLLDPWTMSAGSENRDDVTSLSAASVRNRILRLGYASVPSVRTTAGAPGFLVRFVEGLPSWLRDSEFGRALRGSRLRWNPYQITFNSTLSRNVAERSVYRVPVELPGDSAIRPLPSISYLWRNQFGFELRPFNSMGFLVNYVSTRDLQNYGDSTTMGKLLQLERRSMLGQDVGFERNRQLSTGFNVAPVVASWLRPRFSWNANYVFDRNPNRSDVVREEGGTAGGYRVPESILNSRAQEVGATVDLARLVRGIAGDSSFVTRLSRGFLPADFSHLLELRSGFDRVRFDADLRYQLALGGIDEFRSQNGIPATSASHVSTTTMSGGVRLPLSLQVRLNYRDLVNTAWQRRGDGQTEVQLRSREWPSMNVTWGYTPPSGLRKVLTSVTAQAQYRVQETARVQALPGTAAGEAASGAQEVRTENNTRLLTPSLTLGWWAGITTTARVSVSRTEGISSGNVTRSDRQEWGATLAFAFRPPESIVRLPNRIQTTLAYSTSDLGVCIVRTESAECRVVSDSRRNQLDVRMDTGFSTTLRGGLSFSYILSDQRHLSQKLKQYVFTIFGNITLRAGRLR